MALEGMDRYPQTYRYPFGTPHYGTAPTDAEAAVAVRAVAHYIEAYTVYTERGELPVRDLVLDLLTSLGDEYIAPEEEARIRELLG